jgi:hypothetical protein
MVSDRPTLWRHRDFMLLWGGQTVSEVGSAVGWPLAAQAGAGVG